MSGGARFAEGFLSATPPVAVRSGAKLPGVPKSVLYAELAWRHAAAEMRASSQVFVNEANTDAAAGYAVASLRAGFEQRLDAWRIREFVRVDNVGDRGYSGSVIVAEARGRFFEPAPGRNFTVGVTATAGF